MFENFNLNRKEREKLFRRNEILIAARDLFAQKGFTATTLDDIAQISEFGKGTVYNYFQNKDDLFKAVIENIIEDYYSILVNVAEESNGAVEFFTMLTKRIFEYSVNNKASFLLLVKERANYVSGDFDCMDSEKIINCHSNIKAIFSEKISKGIENGEIKNSDPHSIALFYRSMIFSYIYNLIQEKNQIDIEKESDFILNSLFQGI